MLRRAFHLILVLCLALNGLAAPSAIAAHSHPSAAPVASSGDGATEPCGMHAAATETAVSGYAAHGTASGDEPVSPTVDCCGSDDCRCGCVLPPVMPLPALALLPAALAEAQFRIAAIEPSRYRHAPPLRPPAR
jgi:hypothetical protein